MVLLVDMYILSQGLVMTLAWPCTYLTVQTWACDSPASASPIVGIPGLYHQTLLNWDMGWTSVYSYRMACCVFCMVSGELYWKSSDILTKVLQQLCFLLCLTFLEFRGKSPVNSTPTLCRQRHMTHCESETPHIHCLSVKIVLLWGRTSHLKDRKVTAGGVQAGFQLVLTLEFGVLTAYLFKTPQAFLKPTGNIAGRDLVSVLLRVSKLGLEPGTFRELDKHWATSPDSCISHGVYTSQG